MSNQEALKKELAAIAKRKENALCADCRSEKQQQRQTQAAGEESAMKLLLGSLTPHSLSR